MFVYISNTLSTCPLTFANKTSSGLYYKRTTISRDYCDVCVIKMIKDASESVNDTSSSIISNSRVTFQIVASLTDDSGGVIHDLNMLIVQATGCYAENSA
jgi:hypothetical protein